MKELTFIKCIIVFAIFLTFSLSGFSQTMWVPSGLNGITTSANANVGIGVSNPVYPLHVVAPINNWKARFSGPGSAGFIDIGPANETCAHIYTNLPFFIFNKPIHSYDGKFSAFSTTNLQLQTNGTTRLTILNSNGNVGLGTSTPGKQMEIYSSNPNPSTIRLTFNEEYLYKWDIENNGFLSFKSVYPDNFNVMDLYYSYVRINTPTVQLKKIIDLDNSQYYFDPSSTDISLKVAGKIGIGTTTDPGQSIEIYSTSANPGGIRLTNTEDTDYKWDILNDAGMMCFKSINPTTKYVLKLGLTYAEFDVTKLTVNGQIGVGTIAPETKLDVRGNIQCGGSDFILGKYDGRTQGASNANRAFVHSDVTGVDQLVINYSGDFENGVIVHGPGLAIGTTDFGGAQLAVNGKIQATEIQVTTGLAIGTTDFGGSQLAVNGKIRASEIQVTAYPWADYVFNKDYNLRTLKEIEVYINENGHLPEVPTAREVEENGINVGEMNALLLKKIEELTLYIIQQNNRIEELEKKINE